MCLFGGKRPDSGLPINLVLIKTFQISILYMAPSISYPKDMHTVAVVRLTLFAMPAHQILSFSHKVIIKFI